MQTTERPVAILKSSDIARTTEWYAAAGFEVRGSHPESMPTCSKVARDDTGCLSVHTDNVDAVHEEIHDKVSCDWGVEERELGARELVLRDPDGYFITFTQ